MQWLAEICVRRPVFATVLTLLVVVLGLAGWSRLGVDRFPDIDLPVLTITTVLPGASAEDVENDLTDRIEAAVNTVGSIDELRSVSVEGVSLVYVVFKLEKDIDVAAQDVRDRLGRIQRELPEGTEPPVVTKIDPSAAPIVYAALRGPGAGIRDLTDYADDTLRTALEALPGVGQVTLLGGRDRQIRVLADPVALRNLGLPPAILLQALGTQNLAIPGGQLQDGRNAAVLRVHGRIEDPRAFERVPIATLGDRVLRIDDVARVEDGIAPAETTAVWNGEPAILLSVRKQSGANTVAVADGVRERLEELRASLPSGWTLDIVRDESASIRTGTEAVTEHLIVGAGLAALVVLLFLGSFRSTVIAALAIPTSVLGTFAVMDAIGYTLNNITLLALALSVGIVIDDAIVVLENIYRRIEHEGESPQVAAVEGTREIGLAVLATTLSLIAVFLPVVFLAGIPGRFLRSFGVTMSVAIAVSLFVSFTLTPMLASRWLVKPGEHKNPLERLVDVFYRPIERAYIALLGVALRWRSIVVVLAVGSLVLIPYFGGMARKGFIPVDDQAHFEVTVRAPEGTTAQATALEIERLSAHVRTWPEVEHTLLTGGADEARTPNLATIYVRLLDPRLRTANQEEVKERAREQLIPMVPDGWLLTIANVADVGGGGRQAARVQYNLTGPDLNELIRIGKAAVEELKKVPGAVDVDSSIDAPKPEIGVRIDRERAADLGVTVSDIAMTLRVLVAGQEAGGYTENGERFDVVVQADPAWRDDRERIGQVLIPASRGPNAADVAAAQQAGPGAPPMAPLPNGVPLDSVATFSDEIGPSSVNRLARQRVVTFFANAGPGHGDAEIGAELERVVREIGLPPGYRLEAAGTSKLMAQTATAVLFGFGLAFIFMYLVLAAQFESWLHPLTILLSLPLTLPWAMASLLIFDQALDMFSSLGIFVLFGIVKKNAILQIDHTNQLREHGLPRLEAVLRANQERLRPILMTTLSFVAGMIPLVTSKGIGSGFNRATAGVVIGGQSLSLLLTLIAVPVAYTLFDDIAAFAGRLWARLTRQNAGGAA
jgi:hydrophobe/amphiphile efflux-1 (HAE1) family protein